MVHNFTARGREAELPGPFVQFLRRHQFLVGVSVGVVVLCGIALLLLAPAPPSRTPSFPTATRAPTPEMEATPPPAPSRSPVARADAQAEKRRSERRPQPTDVVSDRIGALGQALRALPRGNIVLTAPTAMTVEEVRDVSAKVGLNVPIAELLRELDQQVEGSPRISAQMSATLTGPGFKIESTTPEEQTIAEGFPTVWTWNVTAKQEGDEQLEVTLYAIVLDGDKERRLRVESDAQKITVNVRPQTWSERLDALSSELTSVKSIAISLGAIATAVLAWFGISRGKKSRGPRGPDDDPLK